MKKYIGVKIIEAESMNLGDYNKNRGWTIPVDEDPKREGCRVIYEDGYVSWSPKEAFEAYRPCDAMTFGLAIEALKLGHKVRLQYWSEDVFLEIQKPDAYSKMTHHYIYVTSRYGLVPWVATQIEILSEKWEIID